MKSEIEESGIVAYENFRLLRRRDVVARAYLIKIAQDDCMTPHFIIEPSINCRRALESWDSHGRRLRWREHYVPSRRSAMSAGRSLCLCLSGGSRRGLRLWSRPPRRSRRDRRGGRGGRGRLLCLDRP